MEFFLRRKLCLATLVPLKSRMKEIVSLIIMFALTEGILLSSVYPANILKSIEWNALDSFFFQWWNW